MLKKVIINNLGTYHYEDEQWKWQSECVGYWVSGNIRYKTHYKDNKRHGICTYYKENGNIWYKRYFWNDEEISQKEYFQNVFKELENIN